MLKPKPTKKEQLAIYRKAAKENIQYCDCGNPLFTEDEIASFWGAEKCVCQKPASN